MYQTCVLIDFHLIPGYYRNMEHSVRERFAQEVILFGIRSPLVICFHHFLILKALAFIY